MKNGPVDKMREAMRRSFKEFDKKNPEVYNVFVRFSDEIRSSGFDNICADNVMYRVRWELFLSGGPFAGGDVRIVFGNFYAQRLMAEEDGYSKFFDLIFPY